MTTRSRMATTGRPARARERAAKTGRRGFLGLLLAAGVGAATCARACLAVRGSFRSVRGPRERELSEADLHGRHDLAG